MRRRAAFDWDEGNREHLGLHGISAGEAEQVILGDPVELAVSVRNTERRMIVLGKTSSGRGLVVVYTRRRGGIRVVTAHPMNRKHKRIYDQIKAHRPI